MAPPLILVPTEISLPARGRMLNRERVGLAWLGLDWLGYEFSATQET